MDRQRGQMLRYITKDECIDGENGQIERIDGYIILRYIIPKTGPLPASSIPITISTPDMNLILIMINDDDSEDNYSIDDAEQSDFLMMMGSADDDNTDNDNQISW